MSDRLRIQAVVERGGISTGLCEQAFRPSRLSVQVKSNADRRRTQRAANRSCAFCRRRVRGFEDAAHPLRHPKPGHNPSMTHSTNHSMNFAAARAARSPAISPRRSLRRKGSDPCSLRESTIRPPTLLCTLLKRYNDAARSTIGPNSPVDHSHEFPRNEPCLTSVSPSMACAFRIRWSSDPGRPVPMPT
jgi:hypothetical protein